MRLPDWLHNNTVFFSHLQREPLPSVSLLYLLANTCGLFLSFFPLLNLIVLFGIIISPWRPGGDILAMRRASLHFSVPRCISANVPHSLLLSEIAPLVSKEAYSNADGLTTQQAGHVLSRDD